MRPNFFCDVATINALLHSPEATLTADLELTVDVIDAPYLLIYTCDEEDFKMSLCLRGEFYNHNDDNVAHGKIAFSRKTGKGQIEAPEEMTNNIQALFVACQKLSALAKKESLMAQWGDKDPEKAGFLVTEDDGQLKFKLVTGRARPNLMCRQLFGDMVMARPYQDEFINGSFAEILGLDDLIALGESGDEAALDRLYMAYLNGDDDLEVEADVNEAVRWLKKYAETENSIALFNLALHYMKGYGMKRDYQKAYETMKAADEMGDEDAADWMEKLRGLPETIAAAQAGDAQAAADYARFLMENARSLEQAGPGKDYEECLVWAKKAAAKENGDALWILGLAYEHGRGVAQDLTQAAKYYRQGAELGNASCQNSLGVMYLNGNPMPRDLKQGFEWTRKSALQGHGLAMYNLGRCYQFGHGVADDMSKAIEWYEKSLKVRPDAELERKVAIFKTLPLMTDDKPADDTQQPPRRTEAPRKKKEEETPEQRRKKALKQAQEELKKLCDSQRDDVRKSLEESLHTRNHAAFLDACEKGIRKKEEISRNLSNDLSAQGFFAFGKKKEIRQQLNAVTAQISALRSIQSAVKSSLATAPIIRAVVFIGARPSEKLPVSQMMPVYDEKDARRMISGFHDWVERGLAVREELNRKAVFTLAAYPEAYTPTYTVSNDDVENECLLRAVQQKNISVSGEVTFDSVAESICEMILSGTWQKTAPVFDAEACKNEILRVLNRSGMTVSEIQAASPALADISNQKIAACVRQLVSEGMISRYEKDRKAYFHR